MEERIPTLAPQLLKPETYTLSDQKRLFFEKNSRIGQATLLRTIAPNIKLYSALHEFFVLDHLKQNLLYSVKFVEGSKLFIDASSGTQEHKSFVTQINVWRNKFSTDLEGVAKHIFWEKLLPIHNLMVTDARQTADGRTFWDNRIGEAFKLDLKVGLWNLNHKTVLWFDDIDHYQDKTDNYYDSPVSFQAYRVIIQK